MHISYKSVNRYLFFFSGNSKMDRSGLDPRTVDSVVDESPITVADITTVGEALVKEFPNGLTLNNLVPAVKLLLRIVKKMKDKQMTHDQQCQFVVDALRYTVDNTNSGPTLENLDPIIKEMIPSVVDTVMEQRRYCSCF